jgi:hypothetical protein
MARGRMVVVVVLGLLLAACGGTDPGADESVDQASGDTGVAGDADAADGDATAEPPPFPWERAAQGEDVAASVPLEEIRSGGPPPDGIPPIDEPVFESIDEAGAWLEDRDPLMLVRQGDDVHAYPLAILTFHEIVNDVVGGEPLVVTYCPLCNSALVFERTVDGEVLSFGTSGRLYNSNLVMYDRSTRSLWSQFTGEAIVGDRLGTTLERLPTQVIAFADLAETHPDAQVLSRDTGHERPYGDNPYVGYDTAAEPFLFDGETGGPLNQIDAIVAVDADPPVAYPLDRVREERVINDEIDGRPVVVLWAPGTASALDARDLSEGRDVGATGVFAPTVDGRSLTLRPEDDGRFVDEETGSVWNVLGRAVDGELEGTALERVTHDDTFWFVQFAFAPDTDVRDGG